MRRWGDGTVEQQDRVDSALVERALAPTAVSLKPLGRVASPGGVSRDPSGHEGVYVDLFLVCPMMGDVSHVGSRGHQGRPVRIDTHFFTDLAMVRNESKLRDQFVPSCICARFTTLMIHQKAYALLLASLMDGRAQDAVWREQLNSDVAA